MSTQKHDGGGLVGFTRAYPIKFERVVAARVDDFEVTGLRIYAVVDGDEVTEVPGGANFEIQARYEIRNYAAGITWWTSCMTAYDVTHDRPVEPKGYDATGTHLGGGPDAQVDAINATMPDGPTTFRVKIHANQKANAGAPPEEDW
ncbi:hypothetical protein KKF82_07900 [Patescibacteria group bacterium]|nr:hypothetical protein [Patescibacteria group bacterium]